MKSSSLKLLAGTLLGSLLLASAAPSFARVVACPKPLTGVGQACYTPTIAVGAFRQFWISVTPYTNYQVRRGNVTIVSDRTGSSKITRKPHRVLLGGDFRGYASTTNQPKFNGSRNISVYNS